MRRAQRIRRRLITAQHYRQIHIIGVADPIRIHRPPQALPLRIVRLRQCLIVDDQRALIVVVRTGIRPVVGAKDDYRIIPLHIDYRKLVGAFPGRSSMPILAPAAQSISSGDDTFAAPSWSQTPYTSTPSLIRSTTRSESRSSVQKNIAKWIVSSAFAISSTPQRLVRLQLTREQALHHRPSPPVCPQDGQRDRSV